MSQKPVGFAYPFSRAPASYDFFVWLAVCATITGGKPFSVTILPGDETKFRPWQTGIYGEDAQNQMLHNVMLPACELFPVSCIELFTANPNIQYTVPGYMAGMFMQLKKPIPTLRVPQWAKATVERLYGKDFVLIVIRESHVHPMRNSNIAEWMRAAEEIGKERKVLILGDDWGEKYDISVPPLAIRAALYEAAYCVLGVNGGALVPAYHNTRVRYVMYKPIADGGLVTTIEGFLKKGIREGGSWPWAKVNQYIQWGEDTFENIMEGYRRITDERGDGDFFEFPARFFESWNKIATTPG